MTIQLRYAVPLLALSALTAGFFTTRRFRPLNARAGTAMRVVAAAPLLGSGLIHLLRPQIFLPLLPPPFPPAPSIIVLSGIAELLGAAGLFVPRTRRPATFCLALLMIAIFPANIHVAGRTVSGLPMPEVPTRTAMQAAYIVLLLIAGWGIPALARPKQSL